MKKLLVLGLTLFSALSVHAEGAGLPVGMLGQLAAEDVAVLEDLKAAYEAKKALAEGEIEIPSFWQGFNPTYVRNERKRLAAEAADAEKSWHDKAKSLLGAEVQAPAVSEQPAVKAQAPEKTEEELAADKQREELLQGITAFRTGLEASGKNPALVANLKKLEEALGGAKAGWSTTQKVCVGVGATAVCLAGAAVAIYYANPTWARPMIDYVSNGLGSAWDWAKSFRAPKEITDSADFKTLSKAVEAAQVEAAPVVEESFRQAPSFAPQAPEEIDYERFVRTQNVGINPKLPPLDRAVLGLTERRGGPSWPEYAGQSQIDFARQRGSGSR